MPRWFPVDPVDLSFFSTAPHVYRYSVDLDVGPDRLWESLTSDASVSAWGPSVHAVRWTSPRPFGVGTERTVTLAAKAITVHERFFHWDEGKRYSFYVYESNRPLFKHFAEDYVIDPTPSGSRLTWSFALEAKPATKLPVRLLSPVNNLMFGQMARSSKGYFAKTA